MILFFWILLFVTTSCQKPSLDVLHKSVSKKDLASTFVKSPDPRQNGMQTGEQLMISWNLGKLNVKKPLFLEISLLMKDKSEEKLIKQLSSSKGLFSYFLLGEDFKHKGGIFTYQVKIITDKGECLKKYEEKMWFSLIRLDYEEK